MQFKFKNLEHMAESFKEMAQLRRIAAAEQTKAKTADTLISEAFAYEQAYFIISHASFEE